MDDATRNEEMCAWANRTGRPVYGERDRAGQAINGLVPIAMVMRHRHLPGRRDRHLEHIQAVASVMAAEQEAQLQRADADHLSHKMPPLLLPTSDHSRC